MAAKKFNCIAATDHVHDGDTATFLIQIWHELTVTSRCRLAELYCPELKNPDGTPNQAGVKASIFLRALIDNSTVRIESKIKDNYGRPLVYVYVKNSIPGGEPEVLVNKLMVDKGFGAKVSLRQQIESPEFAKPPITDNDKM